MESIINKVSQLKKAVFGLTIKTATEPAMRKTNNPFVGRVKKHTTYTDAVLGVDYQNAVNNRLARKGYEKDYQSEAPKGKKHYNAFFYQSLSDDSVFYLKIGLYSNTIIESQYYIDGQLATNEQLAELKTFLQSKTHFCQKQADYGLNEQEQYSIVAPKASNVISIYQGNKPIYIQD